MIYETNYIMHYNKNHDKLGRFAKGTNSSQKRPIDKFKTPFIGNHHRSVAMRRYNKIRSRPWYDPDDKIIDFINDYSSADHINKAKNEISRLIDEKEANRNDLLKKK